MSPAERVLTVLGAVADERARQNVRWGEQTHPDGTGSGATLFGIGFAGWRDMLRDVVDRAARESRSQWAAILLEEVFEALAEDDPAKLRAELVQVAAVAVQWIEAIDRRADVLTRDAEAQAARQERDPGQGWTWIESIAGGRVLDGLRGGDVCEVIRDDRTGRTYIAPLGTPPPMTAGYTVARITVGGGTS